MNHAFMEPILYLNRQNVEAACANLDVVGTLRDVFRLYAEGSATLPNEAYLGWHNRCGDHVRSLSLPAYVGGTFDKAGVKIINGNPANGARGLPRANGLTILADSETGLPLCIMEAAYLSALRTAGVTGLAADLLLTPDAEVLSVIGTGVLAEAHIYLLTGRFPSLCRLLLYDICSDRAQALRDRLCSTFAGRVTVDIATTAEAATRPADLLVTCTTTTEGYIPLKWLRPGCLVAHVSLDDVLPEVALKADRLYVDDWGLVKADARRLLGRLYRQGLLIGPEAVADASGRRIDGTLGGLICEEDMGRANDNEIVLFNPFGCAIADVGLAAQIYAIAMQQGLGLALPR